MKNQKNQGKYMPRSRLRAKLSFDEGFAENPIYSIKATTGEKEKGINMLELIENNFNISAYDRIEATKKKLKELDADAMTPTEVGPGIEQEKIKFSRDSEGNFCSPFSKNAVKD